MPAPRLRFAPSPTGYLHVGGARTALFNYLFARRHGGAFILRIEDTDVERSSADMVTGILDGMRWLGLEWDEGPEVGGPHAPYFQSERLERYRVLAGELVAAGRAYYCYCTAERLQAARQEAEAAGAAWTYDRRCLSLSAEERSALEAAGAPRAIRFRVPDGTTRFDDLVHGPIAFENANIEDFVILRSDGYPTYHLSVVADDLDMRITHVIRGDDHISNTPKHVLLFEAFVVPTPAFGHVPLILGTDKKRLSKRHGATSVTEYARQGYLPEAMVNFLALLGWSPGTDQELFARDELVAAFALDGISGGNAVFNPEKLDWMNAQHLLRLPPDELVRRVRPELEAAGLWSDDLQDERRAWFDRLLALLLPRVKRLGEFAPQATPFLGEIEGYDPAAVSKHLGSPGIAEHVRAIADAYRTLDPFDEPATEAALRALAESRGVKFGALVHATRIALTGRAVSPGLFETLVLIGRERSVRRLDALATFLCAPRG
jgi:glutamyl-tRNA synthetase